MESWKRKFAIIWSGQFVSILSSSVVGYAVIFWMSLETGSAEVLACAAIAGILPQSLIGLFAGVFIDRWDRKRTMILADSFIALCTLVLALLFWLDIARLWHLYVLLACRSIGSAFHTPAMQASVPLLAPDSQLTRIAGINQVIQSLSNIVGPALGALLLSLAPIGGILLLDVVGAIVACTALLFVRIPNPPRQPHAPDILREMHEGFGAIRAVRGMGSLFLLCMLIYLFMMPAGVLFPLLTLNHFGGGSYEMSLIEIVWGGGSLLGGAIMGMRIWKTDRVVLINLVNLIIGASFLASGLLPARAFYGFVLLTIIEGIAGGVFNASFVSVVQHRIGPNVLGRVFSVYYSIGLLPAIVGLLGTGFLADGIGITTTFVLSGSVIMLLSTVGLCLPALRQLDK